VVLILRFQIVLNIDIKKFNALYSLVHR